jgi:hypothetical protein
MIGALVPRASAADKSGISGTVTAGPQSMPIANAQVSLRGGDHRQTTQTDAEGHYAFTPVRGDVSYSVTIEAEGLRAFTKSAVVPREGEVARLDTSGSTRTTIRTRRSAPTPSRPERRQLTTIR